MWHTKERFVEDGLDSYWKPYSRAMSHGFFSETSTSDFVEGKFLSGWRIRIVALGDSLTVGLQTQFVTELEELAPYTRYVEDFAQRHLENTRSDLKLTIINRGGCGELTSDMLQRFQTDVVDHQPQYVIIMGGTNDVGWNHNPSQILMNLRTMYDIAEDNGIRPVACTIPSILGFDELIPLRLRLNDMIESETEKRGMAFIDVFEATADPETNRLLEQYSGDGLHLNNEGYEKIAEVIFNVWLRKVLDQYSTDAFSRPTD